MKIINTHTDQILKVPYELVYIEDAQKLSQELKKGLEKRKINYKDFYKREAGSDVEKNPPREIYEYQNFTLLETEEELLLKKVIMFWCLTWTGDMT